jgi:hypothetical protein
VINEVSYVGPSRVLSLVQWWSTHHHIEEHQEGLIEEHQASSLRITEPVLLSLSLVLRWTKRKNGLVLQFVSENRKKAWWAKGDRQADGPNFGSARMWKSPRMRAHQPDLDVKGQQEGIQCTGGRILTDGFDLSNIPHAPTTNPMIPFNDSFHRKGNASKVFHILQCRVRHW